MSRPGFLLGMTLTDPASVPTSVARGSPVTHVTVSCEERLQTAPILTITRTRNLTEMTSERTQAYGRIVKTLEDIGPAKLQPAEEQRIRDAADNLFFAADLEEARATLTDVDALAEHLVGSGRWTTERTSELVQNLQACGPVTPVA